MQRLTIAFAILALAGLNGWAFEQPESSTIQTADAQQSHLPKDLKLREDQPQKYKLMITCTLILWAIQPAKKE